MDTHKIVIVAKLEFEIDAPHDVVAVSQALVWLCEAITKDPESPLKAAGFTLGD